MHQTGTTGTAAGTLETARQHPHYAWMHRFALLSAFATFLLIVAGALVKSTGSGLAVPDWPLSFGQLMPEMVGGVFFEHGHRMVATFVGMLTVVLALWIRSVESRRWVRRLGIAALAIVLVQGCLGGMTVLLKLPPAVSIAHAGLAEIFFCVMVALALFTSDWWRRDEGPVPLAGARGLLMRAGGLTVLVYAQILLGAVVRHFGAGLSIRDFPLADGKLIPSIDSFYVAIHFAHRVGALLVALMAIATAKTVWSRLKEGGALLAPVRGLALALVAVVAIQILLGGYVIWSERAVEMTTAHVATGALTLVTSWLLTLSMLRTVAPPRRGGGAPSEGRESDPDFGLAREAAA